MSQHELIELILQGVLQSGSVLLRMWIPPPEEPAPPVPQPLFYDYMALGIFFTALTLVVSLGMVRILSP